MADAQLRTFDHSTLPMGVPLDGFSSTKLLRASRLTRTYAAVREDGRKVVARIFDLGRVELALRVESELQRVRGLNIEGLIPILDIERAGAQLLVCEEHVAGITLAELCKGGPLGLDTFLPIGRRLAELLARLHRNHLIHGDIRPSNVVVSHAGGDVFLAGLVVAPLLGRDHDLDDPDTAPYISPEHTGRTGKRIDARSDLYSLGATFYELSCGAPPHGSESAGGLIHAQLAADLRPPRALRAQLPESLARVLIKLLDKAPERRYQSASGLARDLERVKGLIDADDLEGCFELGLDDGSGGLCAPRRLYGREREQALLLAELDHAARQDKPRLMLISGPAGIGKSALASVIVPEVLRRRGLVARGQFDPERQRVPYSGWIAALDSVLGQLLLGPREELESWRARLELRLGRLAALLGALLPKLEPLLGRLPPPPPQVGPRAARNRLQLAIARLLAALSEVGPLALILDDLHAADDSSLELLAALLDGGDCGAVLLLGSFRPGQQRAHAKLAVLCERIAAPSSSRQRLRGRSLELGPLEDQASAQIVRDLLGAEHANAVELVTRRGGSNPKLVLELVGQLVRTRLLDYRDGRWVLAALDVAELPGDLGHLLRAQLEQLDEHDADVLRRAACIGAVFGLARLALAAAREPSALLPSLMRLRLAGFIADEGPDYRFLDGAMREFARAQLSAKQRREIHWRIGQAALVELGDEPDDAALYTCVSHLDAGLANFTALSSSERERLARLNFEAGRRALASASHDPALRFLEVAAALVAERAHTVRTRGTQQPGGELVFEIYFARAQALSLSDEREAGDGAFDELLDWRLSISEYGRAVAGRVELLTIQDRNREAVELALAGLRRCGHVVELSPGVPALMLAVTRAWLAFRRLSNESLLALPRAEDPSACAAMDIAFSVGAAAYAYDPKLLVLLSTVHAQLVLRHGRHASAPLAIAQIALSFATILRQPRAAARLADCALALADADEPGFARAEVVTNLVTHLSRPLADSIATMERAYQRNLDLGEFEAVGYLASLSLSMNIEVGTHLRTLMEICHRLDRDLGDWGSPSMKSLVRLNGALAAALAGDLDAGLGEIVLDELGTPRVLPYDAAALVEPTQMQLYTTKMVRGLFHVLMGEYAEGLRVYDEIADYGRVMMGSWSVPRAAVAHAVAAAACHADAGAVEQRRLRRIIERKLEVNRRLAKSCPENYGHHCDLVHAELTLLQGNFYRAMELFERARAGAERQHNTYVAALACERMAAHMHARGLPILAQGPLREAWLIYRRWGARAKLRALEREQALGEAEVLGDAGSEHHAPASPTGLGNLAIDLETVTAALAAISEELDPELLACKILEAAQIHAGADHGALLVAGEGGLALAALGGSARRIHALSPPLLLENAVDMLPLSVIELVVRTGRPVVVDDARVDPRFARDPYVERTKLRSLLCISLGKRKRRLGLLVLENRRLAARFGEERLSVLGFVATAAGSALDNANLYRALRRSEVQWRSLVDGAPDLIALFDAQGELSFVNRSLPGWIAGQRPILDPDSRDGWTRAIVGALEHGRRGAVEIALIHSEAEEQLHWYDAHVAPLEIEGEPRRVMVIATEITERKQAEARRLELEGQLRQQQRLESLGTLASGVAHEINNPVQGILNYAELLVHSKQQPELVDEFAAEITTEAERVATIVRSLLAFSRREATPERESTTIAEILDGTMSLIHSTLRNHHIELRLELAEQLPPVRCHAQQIQQIIMNLVTNARDALNQRWPAHHAEKLIQIRAAAVEQEGRELVRLSVIDRGAGIPEGVRAHIFDPFFTTKGRDQGTGLGLSVSHGIAQDHGGELWVETQVGVGTRFHLDLPVG